MNALPRGTWLALALTLVIGAFALVSIAIATRPIDEVVVVGDLTAEQTVAARRALAGTVAQSQDAHDIKTALEALPWVRVAHVTRDWPSSLVVEVHAERAIAYWNDDAYINADGKVLVTDLLIGGELPHLYGPEGSEFRVMRGYQQLSRALHGSAHRVEAVTLTARGSLNLDTDTGVTVLLGKEDLAERVARFLRAAETLGAESLARVDARYPRGVAVRTVRQALAGISTGGQVDEEQL